MWDGSGIEWKRTTELTYHQNDHLLYYTFPAHFVLPEEQLEREYIFTTIQIDKGFKNAKFPKAT